MLCLWNVCSVIADASLLHHPWWPRGSHDDELQHTVCIVDRWIASVGAAYVLVPSMLYVSLCVPMFG